MDAPDNTQHSATLLLVDDEANILTSLQRLFHPHGYTIHTAESGLAALTILERESVDLVISDMRMPEMDGAEFLTQVARRWPEVVRILLTGYADLASTVAAINQGHIYSYFSKPWEGSEIVLTVQHALEEKHLREERDALQALTESQNAQLRDLNANLEQKVAERTEELYHTNQLLELAYEELRESYYAAIPVFASMIQLREGTHKGHGVRVAQLARDIAEHMGMEREAVHHIYFAGMLHDIGKLAWPDNLLNTATVKLTAEQGRIIESHPVVGQSLLMGLEPLQETALFIRHHHEHYDGKGYPDGLAGKNIPFGARILAVANDYDGLRSGSLMGETYSSLDARDFLLERCDTRYDRSIVDACIAILEAQESGDDILRELHLDTEGLRSGMVLSRDLVSEDGVLLLSKGFRLNETVIQKIRHLIDSENREFVVHVFAEENKQ